MLITVPAASLVTTLLAIGGLSVSVAAELSLTTSLTRDSSVSDVFAALPDCTVSRFAH